MFKDPTKQWVLVVSRQHSQVCSQSEGALAAETNQHRHLAGAALPLALEGMRQAVDL